MISSILNDDSKKIQLQKEYPSFLIYLSFPIRLVHHSKELPLFYLIQTFIIYQNMIQISSFMLHLDFKINYIPLAKGCKFQRVEASLLFHFSFSSLFLPPIQDLFDQKPQLSYCKSQLQGIQLTLSLNFPNMLQHQLCSNLTLVQLYQLRLKSYHIFLLLDNSFFSQQSPFRQKWFFFGVIILLTELFNEEVFIQDCMQQVQQWYLTFLVHHQYMLSSLWLGLHGQSLIYFWIVLILFVIVIFWHQNIYYQHDSLQYHNFEPQPLHQTFVGLPQVNNFIYYNNNQFNHQPFLFQQQNIQLYLFSSFSLSQLIV